jgi:hypothetical protein
MRLNEILLPTDFSPLFQLAGQIARSQCIRAEAPERRTSCSSAI